MSPGGICAREPREPKPAEVRKGSDTSAAVETSDDVKRCRSFVVGTNFKRDGWCSGIGRRRGVWAMSMKS